MTDNFFLAAQLLVCQQYDSMDAARMAVAGCLDAPTRLPAGSWQRFEYGPDKDDAGIGPNEINRDEE